MPTTLRRLSVEDGAWFERQHASRAAGDALATGQALGGADRFALADVPSNVDTDGAGKGADTALDAAHRLGGDNACNKRGSTPFFLLEKLTEHRLGPPPRRGGRSIVMPRKSANNGTFGP
jgi:hypothetical protein